MLPSEYRELFDTLAQKTSRGEVNWVRSPRTDTFVVSFSDFGLVISVGSEDGESFIRFKLINDQGRDADTFWIGESEPDWPEALELFASARRKAHRIDVTVQRVLTELRKPGPVGEPLDAAKDDLPF